MLIFKIERSRLLGVILFLLIASSIFATPALSGTISGFVHDETNGEALIGANVYIKELNTGSTTNNSGYFVIPGLKDGNYTLVVSYIGYKTTEMKVELKVGAKTNFKIQLKPDVLKTGEIIVTGDSVRTIEKLFIKPVSKMEFSQKQINAIPKMVEADLLRALQTVPGITALSDFSSALYVRGGTPDQNLYLIDGTDVYNPEHAFGIFSTFNTNAIKKVDLSKGGFGAEYGGRLSSVMDVTNLDGNRNNFQGIVNISLLSASTTLQMPIGEIGSVSGSLRRTYIDQTYARWVDEIPDYYFYDGNLKGFFDLSENDKLTFSFFKSQDNLDYRYDKEKESMRFLYDWGNTTGSLNWKHIFNPQLFASFWVTLSRFESHFSFDDIYNMKEKNYLSDYAFKGALEYYYSSNLNFKFGIEQKLLHGLYEFSWDNGLVDINKNRQFTTSYFSINYKPIKDLDVEVGLRHNYFNSEKKYSDFDPRFSIKYRLTDKSNVKFATGIYHQYLNRIPRLFFASIWTTADEYTKGSESKHFILSYQRELGDVVQFETELYYKTYKNIYSYNTTFNATVSPTEFSENGYPVYRSSEGLFNEGDGKSYGIEFLLRKEVGAITGWISYSLSKTEYTFTDINQGNKFVPRHDRTSVINLVLNSDLNSIFSGKWNEAEENSDSKWLIGINFIYSTGQPITTPGSAYYSNTLPDWTMLVPGKEKIDGYNLYPAEINGFKLPPYIRMDLSITYEKNYATWSIAPYLQIINIGNRKNTWFVTYNQEFKDDVITQKIEKVNMLPLLPSLGVTIKF